MVIELALNGLAFLGFPFLLAVIPATLVLASDPDVAMLYRLAKQVICPNRDFGVLIGHVVGTVRFEADGEVRQLVSADPDRLHRSGIVWTTPLSIDLHRVIPKTRILGNRPIDVGLSKARSGQFRAVQDGAFGVLDAQSQGRLC